MQESGDGVAARAPRQQPAEIQAYYRDPAVVGAYIARRTAQPFNGFLHASQVAFINRALRERHPQSRAGDRARAGAPDRRASTRCRWHRRRRQRRDAGAGARGVCARAIARAACCRATRSACRSPSRSFDFVCILKLRPPFPDRRPHAPVRRDSPRPRARRRAGDRRAESRRQPAAPSGKGVDRYRIYDALYDAPELVHELESAGFTVCRMGGIARHFGMQRQLNRLRRLGLGPRGTATDRPRSNNCRREPHRRGWSSPRCRMTFDQFVR